MTNKILVNARTFKLAYGFTSNKETRFYLQGVAVEKQGKGATMTATNGHVLGSFIQEDAFIQWDTETAVVQLPAEGLKACTKKGLSETNWLLIESANRYGDAPALVVTGESVKEAEENRSHPSCVLWQGYAHIIDGTFPDWRRVVPKAEHAAKPVLATFDSKLLAPFVAVAASLHTGPKAKDAAAPIGLAGEDPGAPMFVHTPREDFLGVLMPMRSAVVFARPEWTMSEGEIKAFTAEQAKSEAA